MDYSGKSYVDGRMPRIGLGTWEVLGEKTIHEVVDAALGAGYRFIDTAQVYGNEKAIGNALKELLPKYNLTREDIFITTKLSPANQGKGSCEKSVLTSLENLQTDYIDLLLIHWPGSSKLRHNDERNRERRHESWQVLEGLCNSKILRSIGVSNFTVQHLKELLEVARVSPAVNQCEYHPHYYQPDLVKFCEHSNIHFQAYSSFGSADLRAEIPPSLGPLPRDVGAAEIQEPCTHS